MHVSDRNSIFVAAGVHVGEKLHNAHHKKMAQLLPYVWSLSLHRGQSIWLIDAAQPFAAR
jgi:hypothetical protein